MPLIQTSGQLDLSALITNLGILAVAVAAVISGIYTGWRKVKKMMTEDEVASPSGVFASEQFKVLKATITETVTMGQLSESNRILTDQIKALCHHLDDAVEAYREVARQKRAETEEMHRLRVAIQDLHQHMRANLR